MKAVIFDFAGVIADEGYWHWLAENFELSEEKKQQFNELSDEVDKGGITETEFLARLAKASGKSAIQVKEEIFDKIKPRAAVLQIVKQARKNCKAGMLTNYCKEWMGEIRKTNGLDNLFDAIVVSSEVGMIKPEPGIYLEAAKRLGVKPEDCIMVDDRQANVAAAEKLGMTPLLFASPEDLAKSLKSYGILT